MISRILVFLCALMCTTNLAAQTRRGAPCDSAATTLAMRQCLSADLSDAERDLARYLKESLVQAQKPSLLSQAQDAWQRYRDLACQSAGTQYDGGTMQPVVVLSCRLATTRARIHELWADYLQPDDSLPEPKS
jgi:uncharacterized protein YecT (DUF1311 family)